MKVVFMGTPDFAVYTLKALYENDYEIKAVISQPDKQKGRGKKFQPTPVKEYAESVGLKVYQPERIKDKEFVDFLKTIEADFYVVVAYGQILSEQILSFPKKASINVHGSLLPKYRGAAPIQRAIINGEKTTGITTMLMAKECDAGDMLLKKELEILPEDTYETLHDKLAPLGAQLLIQTLKNYDELIPEKQDPELVSYAPMISKQTGRINFNDKTENIINLIHGLNPFPGAYATINEKTIKIFDGLSDNIATSKEPGEVVFCDTKNGIGTKTADGVLKVTLLQESGGKKMDSTAYMRGHSLPGERFDV